MSTGLEENLEYGMSTGQGGLTSADKGYNNLQSSGQTSAASSWPALAYSNSSANQTGGIAAVYG